MWGLLVSLILVGAPPSPPAAKGWNFPSNGDSPSGAFVAFQFANPQSNGLPFKGPSNQGVTFLWKYMPRQQAGYYVVPWYSRNDGQFNEPTTDPYYGAHPYPQGGGSGTTTHDWEIAAENNDYTNTLSGSPKLVVKDQWYSQALRVTHNSGPNTLTLRFYTSLPSTANGDIIEHETAAGYGDASITSPAITFGDSPWYALFQHERLSGILRGVKLFSKALTEADIISEAASDSLVTSEGQANIWWKKSNPQSVDDLTCDAGTGRTFVWADAANKATLWTG